MKWMIRALAGGLALSVVAAAGAEAQVFTPTYLAPRVANEAGIYLSDGPGDLAAEGILRRNFGGTMLGLRLGIVDAGDTELTLGGELLSPLTTGAPLNLALTAGGQAIVGDADAVGLQVGLDVGATFQSPGLTVTPYIHPRVGFINWFGGDEDLETELLADVGVNLDFRPNLSLRLGVGLSDYVADWGVGLAWRQ
jgi:hypothetical protein